MPFIVRLLWVAWLSAIQAIALILASKEKAHQKPQKTIQFSQLWSIYSLSRCAGGVFEEVFIFGWWALMKR